ncbi:hypothetical protein ABW21_db0201970 [Orbilia brochopaga]|nr:hypothetical protein ABW21_db0201970 [Drechslerella brochopaga]
MGFIKRGQQSRSLRSRPDIAAPATSTATSTSDVQVPSPPPSASRLERLPIEILQDILLASGNPDLALSSRYLLHVLSSSPYLQTNILVSTILDESLSIPEYRDALSKLLARRFFTLELLLHIEESLWPHFREKFLAEHPGVDPDSDKPFLPVLEYRIAWRRLDLCTVRFPKRRFLSPPFTPAKMEFLGHITRRMPDFWAGVNMDDHGLFCARMYELAVRKRCAAMVFLLTGYFHTHSDIRLLRLALLPPDAGDTTWLEPELSRQQEQVSRDDDKAMIRTVMKMRGMDSYCHGWFSVNFMDDWPNEELPRPEWLASSPELEDGLRVLWAIQQIEREERVSDLSAANQAQEFPCVVAGMDLVNNEVLWHAAVGLRGPLLEFLMRLGTPPAELVERVNRTNRTS